MSAVVIPEAAAQRALTRYMVDENGCHISTYSVASHGYAQVGWQRRDDRGATTAHRAAWTAVHGQIPDGMTIDHICKQRRCVNVSHLRMLSNFENARRTFGRDWPIGECANGHSNDFLRLRGSKMACRLCVQEWTARYNHKARGLPVGVAP